MWETRQGRGVAGSVLGGTLGAQKTEGLNRPGSATAVRERKIRGSDKDAVPKREYVPGQVPHLGTRNGRCGGKRGLVTGDRQSSSGGGGGGKGPHHFWEKEKNACAPGIENREKGAKQPKVCGVGGNGVNLGSHSEPAGAF